MAIYEVDGGYVISSHQVWLPGHYEDKKTANYAFRFSDEELKKLQDSVNPGGTITFKMLQELRRDKIKELESEHNQRN